MDFLKINLFLAWSTMQTLIHCLWQFQINNKTSMMITEKFIIKFLLSKMNLEYQKTENFK